MKLFYTPLSPFARKCRIVILEKGLEGRVELIHTPPLDNAPELITANPLGTVPALITEDGRALCDSTVICEYLDILAPQNQLYPSTSRLRIDALSLATLADGTMNATVACVLEGRRPKDKQYDAWVERKQNAVARAISMMAKELPATDIFHIGVIAAVTALDYASLRLPHIDWKAQHPALAQWYQAVSARPSLISTHPDT